MYNIASVYENHKNYSYKDWESIEEDQIENRLFGEYNRLVYISIATQNLQLLCKV